MADYEKEVILLFCLQIHFLTNKWHKQVKTADETRHLGYITFLISILAEKPLSKI